VLPYPVGVSHEVNQGNCSGFGHSGFWKHGYDFLMPIGSTVTAARTGVVGWAEDGCADYDATCTNLVTLIHSDGLVSVYSHLTLGGVLVAPGEVVEQGDTIGLSGVTGNTGGTPHLHFSVHGCNDLPGLPNECYCPSLPSNFSNTDPNPAGLQPQRSYLAQPY
jgi:murein DD-endopeptidase MepM/ murein hydrolase activator NlpD